MTGFRFATLAAVVALAGALGSCGTNQSVGQCTSQDSIDLAAKIVRDEVEKEAAKQLRRDDGSSMVTMAALRASVAQIELAITDIRTSKEDPDSTKKFCAGTLEATFPDSVLDDAQKAMDLVGGDTLTALADRSRIKRSTNKFSVDLDFSIQPTDDRKTTYGEIENAGYVFEFLASLVSAHLAKTEIETAQIAEAQRLAEEKRLIDEADLVRRQTAFAQTKTEYELSRQEINAVWSSIQPTFQESLTADQTGWNQRKKADCAVEAARASTDTTERDTARMTCETRLTRLRISALQSYITSNRAGY